MKYLKSYNQDKVNESEAEYEVEPSFNLQTFNF